MPIPFASFGGELQPFNPRPPFGGEGFPLFPRLLWGRGQGEGGIPAEWGESGFRAQACRTGSGSRGQSNPE